MNCNNAAQVEDEDTSDRRGGEIFSFHPSDYMLCSVHNWQPQQQQQQEKEEKDVV